MMKKKCVLMYCLWVYSLCGYSQTNPLPVTRIKQKGDVLCWAASMEMIFKFNDHLSPNNQCIIAEVVQSTQGIGTVVCTPCPTNCTSPVPNIGNCNFTANENNIILALNGFFNYHNAGVQMPDWQTFKNDINVQHPFLGLKGYPIQKCASDHVLVVIGYTPTGINIASGVNKYYYVNDPLSKCGTKYQKLIFSTDKRVMSICAYINEMYPKTTTHAFRLLIEKKDSMASFPQDNLAWEGEISNNLSQKELDALIKSGAYTTVEKVYYSTKNQRSFSTIELTYHNFKPPYTRMTFQKVDDEWIPVQIEQTEDEHFQIVPRPQFDDIILSKRPDLMAFPTKMLPYKKVVLLPSSREFYYFNDLKEPRFFQLTDELGLPQKPLTLTDMEKQFNVGSNFINSLNKIPFNFKTIR
jgi:hypothetical protein